jgi:2-keto-4-pentenoate hydratase/2-oxohepta-3-ene-1,7-dioic acid hydratase in catechol pathway
MPSYARVEHPSGVSYGLIAGEMLEEIGDLFERREPTGRTFLIDRVKLLAPCAPPKIFAVGRNYKSHLGDRPLPVNPEIFYKPVTCLQNPGAPIVLPPDAEDVHFEGEMVVVIGSRVRHASRREAEAAVFAITCGNDVSDRNWQRGAGKDIQWWRAKGCDTFGPVGPILVTGLNYFDLMLETRLNGEVLQKQRTSDLLRDVPETIEYISRYVTLTPGDIIFTGTPGETRRMSPGDIVEVELEGVGTLRNPVIAASTARS